MSTYVDITDARIAANKPGETGLMTDFRNDIRYLKERADALDAAAGQSIRDDFACSALDTDSWDYGNSGGSAALDGTPDHWLHFQSNGGGQYAIVAASTKRMRIDLDRNHSVAMECRVGKATAAGDHEIFMGFQDEALAFSSANNADYSDMIGFTRGTNANTIRFRMSKGGVAITPVDNLSNWTNWMKLRVEVVSLSSGTDITVRAYVDDVEISGSPFTDETTIPNILLKPWCGQHGGSALKHTYLDYALFYWLARPLSN